MNSRSKIRLSAGGRTSTEPSTAHRLTGSDSATLLPLVDVPSCYVYSVSRSENSGRNDHPPSFSGKEMLGSRSKRPTRAAVLKPGSLRESPSAAASYDQ